MSYSSGAFLRTVTGCSPPGSGPTLELIRELRFGERELEYLRSLDLFADDFLDYLGAFRFRGDLEAMPEGTVCFANEPLIRVTAPRIDGQLLETVLLNQINFQTMAATKAARVVLAAGGGEPGAGERVVDFSPRRDHGIDAAMKVARSAAVAGCGGTSNVAAAMRYGLRPVGRWPTPTCSPSTARRRRSVPSWRTSPRPR